MRPTRICGTPGCPQSATDHGRCVSHAFPTRRTDPEQVAFYNSKEWKSARAQVRREEPFCRLCGQPTTSVDHIDGNWRNRERSNLRGLCTTCERSRTGRQHALKRNGGVKTHPNPAVSLVAKLVGRK